MRYSDTNTKEFQKQIQSFYRYGHGLIVEYNCILEQWNPFYIEDMFIKEHPLPIEIRYNRLVPIPYNKLLILGGESEDEDDPVYH